MLKNYLLNGDSFLVPGTYDALSALVAAEVGFKAIYLSGGGVAASSLGVPDLGITTLNDVLVDVDRITHVCDLPLLVDVDTGWGEAFNISRMTKEMIKAGVAGIHIEDQVSQKRCGHRPNKELVTKQEMCDRIKAASDAKTDENFVLMARTDSLADEGLELAIERSIAYKEAGADAIFAEAAGDLEQYMTFKKEVGLPLLANITEFGKTPIYNKKELLDSGVDMILYPLSAFRAMSKAAEEVYNEIINSGSQQGVIEKMQTRDELYEVLDYHSFEKKLDELFKQ